MSHKHKPLLLAAAAAAVLWHPCGAFDKRAALVRPRLSLAAIPVRTVLFTSDIAAATTTTRATCASFASALFFRRLHFLLLPQLQQRRMLGTSWLPMYFTTRQMHLHYSASQSYVAPLCCRSFHIGCSRLPEVGRSCRPAIRGHCYSVSL